MRRFRQFQRFRIRTVRASLVIGAIVAMLLSLGTDVSAAKPLFADSFHTLNPDVWHVTDTSNPTTPMDHCPGPVQCVPANVTFSHALLNLTVPRPSQGNYGGGQIVSLRQFTGGTFACRFAVGQSRQAMNAMFLFNFTTQDEIDVEVTYDGHDHDGCTGGVTTTEQASNRWEVWLTVWKGTGASSTCLEHREFPLRDATDFHTYTIDWQPSGIAFAVDHKQLWQTAPLAAPSMQLALNAYQPNWKFVQPVPASVMRVNWVRVGATGKDTSDDAGDD